jgi:predicted DNA-binding transcriptional regulator YafY
MACSDRLFRLLQALRTLPAPVTAERLAQETGVPVRSIYRGIGSLRDAGAEIGGERGFGYRLIESGLHEDLRMFRADRILAVEATGMSFRPRRVALLCRYLAELSAPAQSSKGSFDVPRRTA